MRNVSHLGQIDNRTDHRSPLDDLDLSRQIYDIPDLVRSRSCWRVRPVIICII